VTSTEVLLARLVDDAGQFPPARRPLEEAVAVHLEARAGEHAWMLGRFLCPASKVRDGLPSPLGVVSDGDWREDLGAAVRHRADAFELRDGGEDTYEALAAAPLRVFVEAAASLEALRSAGLGAKLRCGGLTAEAFPPDEVVAGFIAECRRLGLPFKATAGLHHPFRTRDDELGVLQHGFVNLLAATALALDDLEPVIAETDPAAFALSAEGLSWRGVTAGPEELLAARELFTAYGSCSFGEPVEDLQAHGILAARV
jgi:hypothetical protein